MARLRGSAILEDARQQLAAAGLTAITTTQRHGSLVETLEEAEPRFDLLIIGKRGEHADFAKGHLSGNLQRVIRTAVCPVLVAARAFHSIERFLLAYDGGPSVAKAIEFVIASPLLKGAACHIFRAGHLDDKARWFLDEAATGLRSSGYEVTSHAVAGEPEAVIANTIKRERIQLLVMGAYGHSGPRVHSRQHHDDHGPHLLGPGADVPLRSSLGDQEFRLATNRAAGHGMLVACADRN